MRAYGCGPRRPSTGAATLYVSVVREPGQAEPVAQHPAREHQHRDRRRARSRGRSRCRRPASPRRTPSQRRCRGRPPNSRTSANISGQRVSWSPRSMPAPITCAPSTSWKAAATSRKLTASAITAALAGTSARNKVTSGRGMLHMTSAIAPMKPTPSTHAVQPARVMPGSIAAAERQADADRRRLAEAERNHEGQRGELQRDGVRRDRWRADPAHEIGGQREHAHLERHRQRRSASRAGPSPASAGQSKRHQRPNSGSGGTGGRARSTAMSATHRIEPGERAAEPAADQAERGQAEMAEDQRPAEQRIERDPADAQPQHDRAAARARRRNGAAAGTAATARCTTCRRAGTSGPGWPARRTGRRRASDRPTCHSSSQ